MNTKTVVLAMTLSTLLAACAGTPATKSAPPQVQGGWYETSHEPRGRPYCIEASRGVEDDAFFRCITGWRERIWVEDVTATPQRPVAD